MQLQTGTENCPQSEVISEDFRFAGRSDTDEDTAVTVISGANELLWLIFETNLY